jgi:hypothetical protein
MNRRKFLKFTGIAACAVPMVISKSMGTTENSDRYEFTTNGDKRPKQDHMAIAGTSVTNSNKLATIEYVDSAIFL